jgi:flagellar FliL protein
MAKEDDLDLDIDGGEALAPKSKSRILIISLIVVLVLGISTAATLMLSGILSDDGAAANVSEEDGAKAGKKPQDTKKADRAPLNYVPLDPPFVVNFGGDSDIRFLQVTVEVGTRDPAVVELVKEHRPAIRNSLVLLFSSQDPYALNAREGKEKLRDETLTEVQKVLKQETGSPGVESVFFTSFVMQ